MKMCVCTNLVQLGASKEIYKQKPAIGSELAALARAVLFKRHRGTNRAGDGGLSHSDFTRRAKISIVHEQKIFWSGTLIGGG